VGLVDLGADAFEHPAHRQVVLEDPAQLDLLQPAREAAWRWLTPQSRGWDDTVLWSRLIESPYDDVRFSVVRALEQRSIARFDDAQLAHVWTSVLLNVHRGGRTKMIALRQISEAIQSDPQRAAPLLPVLAVAIRSVRLPEARSGLAAVVGAIEAHPPLLDAVRRFLPEVQISEEAAAL